MAHASAQPSHALRVVVADEKKRARARLMKLLQDEKDVDVIAEVSDGAGAVEAIRTHAPHLVFLNVHMPHLNGFDVLREVHGTGTLFIFVAACGKHALRAFDEDALDYLLKPYSDGRFAAALRRARQRLGRAPRLAYETDRQMRLRTLGQRQNGRPAPMPARLPYKDGTTYKFVALDQIRWAEASDVYVVLHTETNSILLRETLTNIEERLGGTPFVRIHRSFIVNANYIQAVIPARQGRAIIELAGGTKLNMSRSYRKNVMALVEPA